MAVSIAIGRNFWVLAYSPLVNVQSSGFGMLGFWGYRRWSARLLGGGFLALTLLKPQLAVFPVSWAAWGWLKEWRSSTRPPRSLIGFLLVAIAIYLPSFLVYPGWLFDWLGNLREVRFRALSGFIPRVLYYFHLPSPAYYALLLLLFVITAFLLLRKQLLSLDRWVLLGFIFSPFTHDYDLVQLIPMMEDRRLARISILASLPGWITLLFFYDNDHAWATMTAIPIILLSGMVFSWGTKSRDQHKLSIRTS